MKAVYFMNNNHNWGHVSFRVWDLLEKEGFFEQKAGFQFAGQDVMMCERDGNEFFFAPTDIALCLDYPRFLPEMNAHVRHDHLARGRQRAG